MVPVALGCCPDAPRCLLCPPPPSPPDRELLDALVDHYRRERAGPDDTLEVRFFGGPLPPTALLDDLPGEVTLRIRPDLLGRDDAAELARRGVRAVELDALSLDDVALRTAGRRYRGSRVLEMAAGLRALGIRPGVVLAPGLPGTDFAGACEDARRCVGAFDTARVHPVLVLAGSRLEELHHQGRYRPLGLGAAITVSRAMVELLEGGDVEVIRVGLQPGPDGFGRAVAGPAHPAFGQLVAARRTLGHLGRLLDGVEPGSRIVIRCAPADETAARGPSSQNVRNLRADFALESLRIQADPALVRGQWRIETIEETP